MNRFRSSRVSRVTHGRSPLLIVSVVSVLVLVAGLVYGLTNAFAASSSPTPANGKQVVLRLGWTQEPDNLNVFIGYQNTTS
jgi:hypothetical protein